MEHKIKVRIYNKSKRKKMPYRILVEYAGYYWAITLTIYDDESATIDWQGAFGIDLRCTPYDCWQDATKDFVREWEAWNALHVD